MINLEQKIADHMDALDDVAADIEEEMPLMIWALYLANMDTGRMLLRPASVSVIAVLGIEAIKVPRTEWHLPPLDPADSPNGFVAFILQADVTTLKSKALQPLKRTVVAMDINNSVYLRRRNANDQSEITVHRADNHHAHMCDVPIARYLQSLIYGARTSPDIMALPDQAQYLGITH